MACNGITLPLHKLESLSYGLPRGKPANVTQGGEKQL